MHCASCDYALWNLKARQCPECGRPFQPSDFTFKPYAVQFCCPHCDQTYYGVDESGHLSPRYFSCVKCKQQISMDDMILRAASGLTDDQTRQDNMPWLERKQIGWFKGWMRTVGRSMINPGSLMRNVAESSSPWQAIWFTIVTLGASFITFAVSAIVVVIILAIAAGGGRPGPQVGGVLAGTMLAVWLGMFVLQLLFAAVWSVVTHGLLRLSGGTQRRVNTTMNAVFYSSGPLILNATPCIGGHLAVISYPWWVVTAILSVKSAHMVSGLRATCCTLTLPLLTVLTITVGYVALFMFVMNSAVQSNASISTMYPSAGGETQIVTHAVLQSAADNNGIGPTHGASLISEDLIASYDLVGADTGTFENNVPVGTDVLSSLDDATAGRRQSLVDRAGRALPANVVAHRVGDFVFTYHGIDFDAPPSGLWIVVFSPDPAANVANPSEPLVVGMIDGSVQQYSSRQGALASQNAVRLMSGLSPLPDPDTVTHNAPAIGK